MKLSTFLTSRRGASAEVARALEVSAPVVSQWLSSARPMPPNRCPAVERATAGAVTVEELRPDLQWVRVPDPHWPNPAGRPCLDVAAPTLGKG